MNSETLGENQVHGLNNQICSALGATYLVDKQIDNMGHSFTCRVIKISLLSYLHPVKMFSMRCSGSASLVTWEFGFLEGSVNGSVQAQYQCCRSDQKIKP